MATFLIPHSPLKHYRHLAPVGIWWYSKQVKSVYYRGVNMHILWGSLIMSAGLFLLVCGSLRSNFFIYRLLVARSKILWGQHVYRFHQITGVIVIIFGVLVALKII